MLDEEEQDLNETISKSLNKNENYEVQEWTSRKSEDTKAEVIPINKYNIEEKHVEFLKNYFKDGKRIEEDSTACRDENGN